MKISASVQLRVLFLILGAVVQQGAGEILQQNDTHIEARQFGPPLTTFQFFKDCRASDFNSKNWATASVDAFLQRFIASFGTPRNFPFLFFGTEITDVRDKFDCSNLQSSECQVFAVDRGATLCSRFIDPRAAFIVQAYTNLFQSLQETYLGAAQVKDKLVREKFIDQLIEALKPKAKPLLVILAETLFKTALSLFIPGSGFVKAGRALTAFGNVYKKLDSIKSAADFFQSTGPKPESLQELLDDTVPFVQNSLQQKYDLIFTTAQSGVAPTNTAQYKVLQGGELLDAKTQPGDIFNAMLENTKYYLASAFMQASDYTLVVFDQFNTPCEPPMFIEPYSKQCFQFAVGTTEPNNSGALAGLGLNYVEMLTNALDCFRAKKTAADFDPNKILEDPRASKLPFCLFGMRTFDNSGKHTPGIGCPQNGCT